MTLEFNQGNIDNTYISIVPNRGGVIEHPPIDRLTWPTYMQAERHKESPFVESHLSRAGLPVEYKGGKR
jgi:hypothetical protein